MKKLFVLMFVMLLLVGTVSAVQLNPFGKTKTFNPNMPDDINDFLKDKFNEKYGLIRISKTTMWIPSGKVAEYTLTSNTEQCLINCEAQGGATLYQDGVLFEDIKFVGKDGSETSIRDYQIYILETQYYDVEVPDTYKEVCIELNDTQVQEYLDMGYYKSEDEINRTQCWDEVDTLKNETRSRNVWNEYNGEELKEGDYTWKLTGSKNVGDVVDFIPVVDNQRLDEWAWWNSGWSKKKQVNITGDVVSNYSLKMIVEYNSNMNNSFYDIRFLDNSEATELGYWFEEINVGVNATVWVKVNNNNSIYMYYGNNGVSSTEDISKAFYCGYDFNDNDVSDWYTRGTNPLNASNGILNVTAGSGTAQIPCIIPENVSVQLSTSFMINNLLNKNIGLFIHTQNQSDGRGIVPFFWNSAGTTKFQVYSLTSGTSYTVISQTSPTYSQNVWNNLTMVYNQTSFFLNLNGGTNYVNSSTHLNTESIRSVIMARGWGESYGDSGTFALDDFRFMKYMDTIPTVTFGAEESSSSITITLNTPADGATLSSQDVTFNVTMTPDGINISNATLSVGSITNFTTYDTNESTTLINITTLSDGLYFWNVSAGGSNGVTYTSETYNFTIDTTPPQINITYPENTTYTSSSTELNYTYTDTNIGYCWYSTDGGDTNSSAQTAGTNFTGLSSSLGSNTWTLYCNDSAGNFNTTEVTFIRSDETPPEIEITFPENSTYNTQITELNYTYDDLTSGYCWYSTDAGVTNSTPVGNGSSLSGSWDTDLNTGLKLYYDMETSISGSNGTDVVDGLYNFSADNTKQFFNSGFGLVGVGMNVTTGYNWETKTSNPADLNPALTNETTINYWIKGSSSSQDSSYPFYKYSVGEYGGFAIGSNTATIYADWKCVSSGNVRTTLTNKLPANTWTMLSLVVNSTGYSVYVNGTYIVSANCAGGSTSWTTGYTVGALNAGKPSYLMDEVGYWNRSLSADEIATLYNSGSGITYSSGGSLSSTEGSNTWTLYCNDSAGNLNSTEVTFEVDTTYPQVSIEYPTNTTYTTDVTILNYTYIETNADTCWYTTDLGNTNNTITCGNNVSGLTASEGSNTWKVYMNDTAGNENSSSITFFKDTLNPQISILYPTNTTYTELQTEMNYSYSEANVGYCWFSNDSGVTNSTPITGGTNFTGLNSSEGSNTWNLYCNDSVGNFNSTSVTFTLNLDDVAPDVSIIFPTNTSYTTDVTLLNYSYYDAASNDDSCWFSNDSGATNSSIVAAGVNMTGLNSSEGSNTWIVFCNDTFGNENSSTITFFKDTILPVIVIEYPENTTYNVNVSSFNFTYTEDNPDSCWYSLDGGENNVSLASCGTNATGLTSTEGSNTWTIYMNDTAGNENSTSVTFTKDISYPTIEIDYNPTITNVSINHTINFTATDTNLDTCWWVYGNETMTIDSSNMSANLFDNDVTTTGSPTLGENYSIELNSPGGNIIVEVNYTLTGELGNFTISTANCSTSMWTNRWIDVNVSNPGIGGSAYFYCDDVYLGSVVVSSFANPRQWVEIYAEGNVAIDNGYVDCSSGIESTFNFTTFKDITDLFIYASDTGGNTNFTHVTLTFDDTYPLVDIVYPTNITYTTNVSELNYTISDTNGDSCWYSTDGGETNSSAVAGGINFTGITSTEGSNTWNLYCNDSVGNLNSTSVTFFKDTLYPEVEFIAPTNTSYANQTQLVNLSYTEANLDTLWFFNGTANVTYTVPVYVVFPDGSNTIYAYVNDTSGQENYTEVTFYIDSTGPVIDLTVGDGLYDYGSMYTAHKLNYTVTDVDLDVCWLEYNGANDTINCNPNETIQFVSNATSHSTTSATYTIAKNITINGYARNITASIRSSGAYVRGLNVTIYYLNGSAYSFENTSTGTAQVNFTYTNPFPYEYVKNVEVYHKRITLSGTSYQDYADVYYYEYPEIELTEGVYTANIWANDSFNNIANYSFDWSYKVFEVSRTHNVSSYETAYEGYSVNLTANTSLTAVTLNYGSEHLSMTQSGTIWSYSRDLPLTVTGNNTVWFNFTYGSEALEADYDTYQYVGDLYWYRCNVTTPRYLNISFKDEGNSSVLSAAIPYSTFEYYLGTGTVTDTYSVVENSNTAQYYFCLTPTDRTIFVDPYVQYKQGTAYPQRVWDPAAQTYTNTTTHQVLYLAYTTDGQYVTFLVVNSIGDAIEGVNVTANRTIGGLSTVVSQGTTGADGTVTFWLNPDFIHSFVFEHSSYDTYTTSFAPTQTGYTIYLGGAITSTPDYYQGIVIRLEPNLTTLENQTDYTFAMYLESNYWNATYFEEFGFNLRYKNGTIIEGNSTTLAGTQIDFLHNSGGVDRIYMDYYWVINSTYSNGSMYWNVFNTSYSQWSISNFFDDFDTYFTSGMFGMDDFGKSLIIFIIIFLTIGLLSFRYGLTNPGITIFMIFLIIFFFDVVLNLVPTMTLGDRAIENLPTFLAGLAVLGYIFKEVNQY